MSAGRQLRLAIADAWTTIRAHPGRVLVSTLALACGAASLVVLLAALGGLQRQADRLVEELGADVFAAVSAGDGSPLQLADARRLAGAMPDCLTAPARRFDRAFAAGRDSISVIQTDEHYAGVRHRRVARGRFLDGADLAARDRVAVITRALSDRLGLGVGQMLRMRDVPFRIVGILEDGTGFLPGDSALPERATEELTVFTPITTPAYWSPAPPARQTLDAVFIRALDGGIQPAEKRARRILAAVPRAPQALWVSPATLVRKVQRVQAIVSWSAGATTVFSLVMGGAVTFALMIASVRERTREIGLRISLGASRAGVAAQFACESALVAAGAAVAGCATAHLLLGLAGPVLPLPMATGFITWFVPVAAILGVAALGTLPACLLAAASTPADTLRAD